MGDWRDFGACVDKDPDLFFPGRGEDTTRAKAICAGCPVKRECLEHALDAPEKFGIWGATSEHERRVLRRNRTRVRVPPPIRHGTPGGDKTHRMRGEKPCAACAAARAAYVAERKAQLRVVA